jgi:hypothetical protein
MRNPISVAFFLFMLAQLCQPAFASEIIYYIPSLLEPTDYALRLGLSGEIKNGDAEKLAETFTIPFLDRRLILDSPGGDVEEALRIASLVKTLHLITIVKDGSTCASSCFFIFLAGDQHLAIGILAPDGPSITSKVSGYIGLHRPYIKLNPAKRDGSIEAEKRQHDIMQIMGTYLRNQDVPQRLIDLMMSRPSNDIYWLTQNDIDQLGEYSPGREELLIARCGYSRDMYRDNTNAIISHDSAAMAVTEARISSFKACSVDAFPDLMEERLKNIEHLRKGWRPWSQSKVGGKRP